MILGACSNSTSESVQKSKSTQVTNEEEVNLNESNSTSGDSADIKSDNTSSENGILTEGVKEDKEILSQYSSEQIEYARVWLQLGPNQELDELNVRQIPAGTPINPDDDTSANYPEDVIQLAGSRLVDGSVTYSGNGDGTINVYNVPLRWDGSYPAGEKFYIEIIENKKQVYVDTGNDKKIIELIKLLKEHS
ncbi:hypothetical protein ACWM35_18455 [Neobacillus sp. K501]